MKVSVCMLHLMQHKEHITKDLWHRYGRERYCENYNGQWKFLVAQRHAWSLSSPCQYFCRNYSNQQILVWQKRAIISDMDRTELLHNSSGALVSMSLFSSDQKDPWDPAEMWLHGMRYNEKRSLWLPKSNAIFIYGICKESSVLIVKKTIDTGIGEWGKQPVDQLA